MAGLTTFSSPDEHQINQILSEAMDHCVLEQLAAINCSSFSHSSLPSHLETRFRKLKSFPSYPHQLAPNSATRFNDSAGKGIYGNSPPGFASFHGNSSNLPSGQSKVSSFEESFSDGEGRNGNLPSGQSKVSSFKESSTDRKGKGGNSQDVSSGSNSFNSSSGQSKVSSFKEKYSNEKGKNGNLPSGQSKVSSFKESRSDRKGKKGNLPSGYTSSPADSSNSSTGHMNFPKMKGKSSDGRVKNGNSECGSGSDSEEEARKSGCLWCSPKRVSKKKSSGRNVCEKWGIEWGKDEKILSDLSSFSAKEQKRRMKEAKKEQEKLNKEAEQIVKWAKQVSARMDFSVSDDEFSDDSVGHHFGRH